GSCSRVTLWGTQQYSRITVGTNGEVGKQLPYVPKASASAEYDAPIGAVQAGASVNYSGMSWADDLNQQPLGSAVTAGLHVVAPLHGGVDLTLNVNNLTDARYLSSIDRYAPPQVISLALSAPLGSAQAPACSK
ncbi:MAG TPA: TonB-dependent receptor, partial [Candidatus Acidoferrum sp.]|nr:TonB-dependent receptor [Candidatus Acidoferrum sp.]